MSPESLGISDAQWASYDATKKDLLRKNYWRIKQGGVKKLNTSFGIKNGEGRGKNIFRHAPLLISIFGGEVIVPPFVDWVSYYPIKFIIKPKECVDSVLYEVDGKRKIELRVCYLGNVLFIDPSRFDLKKRLGSAIFYYSPIWEEGFVYRGIDTTGYVRFRGAKVEIEQIEEDMERFLVFPGSSVGRAGDC